MSKTTNATTAPIHVLCIMNSKAGGGLALRRWDQIAEIMRKYNISWHLVKLPETAVEHALSHYLEPPQTQKIEAIVGIGGDGTHSSILNSLMRLREKTSQTLPPYALLPLGTGNDIAKSFNMCLRKTFLPDDIRRSVAAIRYGVDYRLDLALVNDLYFADALSIGLDSAVLQEHNRHKEELNKIPFLRRLIRGNLLYSWSVGRRFLRHRVLQAEIHVDGKQWYTGPLFNLVINNTRVYAGEFVLCPDAYANDGLLELIVFAGQTDYLGKYLTSFRSNPHRVQEMMRRLADKAANTQGRLFEIKLSSSELAQADGEELPPSDTFKIKVIPQAITLRLPVEPA